MKARIYIKPENPEGQSIHDDEWKIIIDFLETLRKLEGSFTVFFDIDLEL